MTSVVVSDGGGNIVEYVTVVEEPQRVSQQSSLMIKMQSRVNDKLHCTLHHFDYLLGCSKLLISQVFKFSLTCLNLRKPSENMSTN